MSHGKRFEPTASQLARILDAHADHVRHGEIGASFGVCGAVISRIVQEHGTPRPVRGTTPGLNLAQRQHLARLDRGPAPIVSDPTRSAVLMPAAMLNRQTVAWLQARGLVTVTGDRPRVASITDAGREALATARAQIARVA